jgi:hypothetical protein
MPSRIEAWLKLVLLLAAFGLAWAAAPAARAQSAFTNEQLDQMLAPIALYPDSLLSQVLMAATYPADVADAAKWSKANPSQKGDAAVKAVESKGWDPAVASLVAFPEYLAMAAERPDWVQNVGDAFLASPEAVMDSVQRLRGQAHRAGNLKTTQQQIVIVEQAPAAPTQTIIRVEPAQPQIVYVPVYNPTVVYGPWPSPSYPPYYWPTPGYAFGNALLRGIAFGTGIAITNAIWGGFDWGRNDVNINVNRYNNINVNKQLNVNQNNVSWKHNADNRKGVPYRDARSRQQYDRQVPGAEKRADYRGKDADRDASRDKAQAAMKDRGVDPAKGRDQLKSDPQVRDRAQSATQSRERAVAQDADRSQAKQAAQNRATGRDNALAGAAKPEAARQQMDRGAASRQAAGSHAASAKPAVHTGDGGARAAAGARAGGGAGPAGGHGGGRLAR